MTINTLAKILIKFGISANFLTAAGLVAAGLSGIFAYQGHFFLAGAVLLFSGALDMLDGAVAREAGTAKAFGGILDSTLDRYGDGFVLGGILFYCLGHLRILYAILSFSALLGSFAISYIRARAECEIETCRVGFWERGERLVLIALALLLHNLAPALWILGVGAHWTAFQRLYFAHSPKKDIPVARAYPFYHIKIGILIGILLFLKIPL